MRGLLFDLVDEEQDAQALDEGEKNKFSLKWVAADEAAKLVDDEGHRLVYEALLNNLCYHDEGRMINSGPYIGMSSDQVRERLVADLADKGLGQERVNYKMRDWLISRQRYWGAPIPMIHCEECGTVPVPEDQLPVVLPEMEKFEPSGDGRSPLANDPVWVNVDCPQCGGPAQRETDTMDGFACSSWYFLRFADPHNDEMAFDPEKVKFWLPVDDYIGGAEHAVMHLLYARMWTKVMYDAGLINFDEPFTTLRNQGMILAPDGQKMSKSKGNTIEPGVLIDQGYGADAIRIMELFIGPWNQAANWSVEGMGGAYRFLQRIWTLVQEHAQAGESNVTDTNLSFLMHRTIKKVSQDITNLSFNTAIATLMETVNELYKIKAEDKYANSDWAWALETLIILLAPFAPHIAEELWQQTGHTGSIHTTTWPKYSEELLVQDTVTVVVQVNGKLRAELKLASDATEEQAISAAKGDERVANNLTNKTIRKTIYLPGRLINFVV